MKIYLIGMPLSGKSTVGIALADKLIFDFIDLDEYIEDTYNISIDETINSGNEDVFRALEKEALKDCLKLSNTVISTGGGIVVDQSNYDLMSGLIVFLDVSIEVLKKREKTSKQRPLLKDANALVKTYEKRIDMYYSFADIIIKEIDIELITNTIIDLIEQEGLI